jgi:hypothetical protein
VTADLSRYLVVVTIHRGRRPFQWEIWDKQKTRRLPQFLPTMPDIREAEAAGSEALARRWGHDQATN